MYHLFIDEAGSTSHLTSNRHTQRFLNLTGIVFDNADFIKIVTTYNLLRAAHFGHKPHQPIVLHRSQLAGRRGVYARLRDPAKNRAWEAHCLQFIGEVPFQVISVTIDKVAFYHQHPKWVSEPYDMCAFNMIERFCLLLRHQNDFGHVHLETRNPKQDDMFEEAFNRFCEEGNRYIGAGEARVRVGQKEVQFWKKNDDVVGCQLADMASQPMMDASRKWFTGIDHSTAWNRKLANALWPKLYRDKYGRLDGCGLVWRPKQKRPAEGQAAQP